MSYSVKKINDVNFNNICYSTPKKTNTYYQSSINYDMNGRKKPFMIQTPYCINKTNFSLDKKHLSIEIEIPQELYEYLINMDEHNADIAFNNSKSWFKQEIPKDIIDDYYKSSIKPFKDGSAIKMKVKIPYYNGECQTKIYDNQRNLINLKDIPNESNIILIIHVNAIRFLKQNFYTDMYVTQIKVCYKKDDFTIPEICIVDDNDFEIEKDLIEMEEITLPEMDKKEKEENEDFEQIEQENTTTDTENIIEKNNEEIVVESQEENEQETKENEQETKENEQETEENEQETEENEHEMEEIQENPIEDSQIIENEKEIEENNNEISNIDNEEKGTESNIIEMTEETIEEPVKSEEEEIVEEVFSEAQIKKRNKLMFKLEEAKKEYQYACNIFKQAEELVLLKKSKIESIENKLNELN